MQGTVRHGGGERGGGVLTGRRTTHTVGRSYSPCCFYAQTSRPPAQQSSGVWQEASERLDMDQEHHRPLQAWRAATCCSPMLRNESVHMLRTAALRASTAHVIGVGSLLIPGGCGPSANIHLPEAALPELPLQDEDRRASHLTLRTRSNAPINDESNTSFNIRNETKEGSNTTALAELHGAQKRRAHFTRPLEPAASGQQAGAPCRAAGQCWLRPP